MKLKTRLIISAIIAAIIIGLGITAGIAINNSKLWKDKYDRVQQTQTMMMADLQSAQNQVHQYELTLDDLRYMNDSMTDKLLSLQKRLKVKDKEVQNLQYMYANFKKTDTLELTDTIFVQPDFCLDTVLGDEWIANHLHLEYPGKISIATNVESKRSVIVYLKKETINPPKKCWLARLFQRKRKVANVYIEEENPYICNQQNMFIEVIKK